MELDWITAEQAGARWGITTRQVQSRCKYGYVEGAVRLGKVWLIPKGTSKPIDGRTKEAKREKK